MSFMSGMEHQKLCSVYRSQKKYSFKKLSLILFIYLLLFCSVYLCGVTFSWCIVGFKKTNKTKQKQKQAISAHHNLLFFGNRKIMTKIGTVYTPHPQKQQQQNNSFLPSRWKWNWDG